MTFAIKAFAFQLAFTLILYICCVSMPVWLTVDFKQDIRHNNGSIIQLDVDATEGLFHFCISYKPGVDYRYKYNDSNLFVKENDCSGKKKSCIDHHGSCDLYAKQDYCEKEYRSWMSEKCRKACGLCVEGESDWIKVVQGVILFGLICDIISLFTAVVGLVQSRTKEKDEQKLGYAICETLFHVVSSIMLVTAMLLYTVYSRKRVQGVSSHIGLLALFGGQKDVKWKLGYGYYVGWATFVISLVAFVFPAYIFVHKMPKNIKITFRRSYSQSSSKTMSTCSTAFDGYELSGHFQQRSISRQESVMKSSKDERDANDNKQQTEHADNSPSK